MSDFKVTPEVELNTAQMLERYQLQDETNLRRWAKTARHQQQSRFLLSQ